ncbi:hypothetical protein Q4566_05300 [Tamlana sp. 2_MG-2023]|uniref:hypothetical protein n=1 Tax=unclassified Tamlana TaxID=2614803 RepID=UPI0026E23E6A|nr:MULTISPECIES: hypothetical protein [unclassified Tamlana]MDO6759610.1 hypothetical protein [Tamlana sp. 2_MG-2023]MDO6792163.1 hypothetical protein [Tamlana sp. 1_MG-2023]
MNWSSEQIELVESRILLIKQLIEAKEHFRGRDKIKNLPDRYWTHSYKDYAALRVYLALTCFDILGQPNDWMDFNSWLRSKKRKKEREEIIDKSLTYNYSEFILSVNNEYNKIYGVKSSFYKFIQEVLSQENKQKLFDSIKTSIQLTPRIVKPTGTTLATGREIKLPIERKEKFLFNIRNSFTHKGVSIADPAGGIFDNEKPSLWPPDWKPKWGFSGIHKETINGDLITFSVRRWPFILIEIIEDTINNK